MLSNIPVNGNKNSAMHLLRDLSVIKNTPYAIHYQLLTHRSGLKSDTN